MATATQTETYTAAYSPLVYNTVNNSLQAATRKATKRNIHPKIYTLVRECFLKHNVEDDFSACLIHRHYDLKEDERNVESNGRAIASRDLSGLYPSSWMFYDGKCYPYEYKRYIVPQPPRAFVEDLGRLLQQEGLCDLVGIQTYTNGIVGIETTDRQTNISTTIDQDEKLPIPSDMAPASWGFFRE